MKTSELILKLSDALSGHGNLDVIITTKNTDFDIHDIDVIDRVLYIYADENEDDESHY